MPAHLGELLERLRLRTGLKVLEVLRRLNENRTEADRVARSTFYGWEKPPGRPDPEDLQRLLNLYNATPSERLLAWELRATRFVPPEESPTEPYTPTP